MGRVEKRHSSKDKASKKASKEILGSSKIEQKKRNDQEAAKKSGKKGKKKKQKNSMKLINKILIILVLLFVAVIGSSLAYQFLTRGYISNIIPVAGEEQALFNNGEVNILMLGADARPGEDASRSDTILVAHVDFNEGTARVVSIPRDTVVNIPGNGKAKINAAYAYGGLELTKETIEEFYGIKIDKTIEINFDSFSDTVNMLGGVEIIMEEPLYDEDWQLDLKAGSNTLDGETALRFVRFRGTPTGDFGRMGRQQLFLKSLAHDIKTKANIFEQTPILTNLLKDIKTDISLNELLYMFSAYKKIDDFKIDTWTSIGNVDFMDDLGSVIIPIAGVDKMVQGFLAGDLVVDDPHVEGILPELITITEKAQLDRDEAEKQAELNSENSQSFN